VGLPKIIKEKYEPVFWVLQETSVQGNRYPKVLTAIKIRPINSNFRVAQNSVFAAAGKNTS
jgi:hypothetical protein